MGRTAVKKAPAPKREMGTTPKIFLFITRPLEDKETGLSKAEVQIVRDKDEEVAIARILARHQDEGKTPAEWVLTNVWEGDYLHQELTKLVGTTENLSKFQTAAALKYACQAYGYIVGEKACETIWKAAGSIEKAAINELLEDE